ncbi:MAG: hypothetical protein AABN95_16005 [Acidobacteriota bacterium]
MTLKAKIISGINRIPSAWRFVLLVSAALLIVVLVWFYGMRLWNGVGNWMYHHSETDAKKEISEIKTEAQQAKDVARDALAAYESQKRVTDEKEAQRALAEKELMDRRKTTDQKLAAYEAAVDARPTVTGPGESTRDMCLRAAALGITDAASCQ